MTTGSATDLLVLHAVRLTGMADDHQVAAWYGLEPATTSELLLDLQAYGWVSRVDFAGTGGWTLTDTGRRRNEQQLAAELTAAGAAADVLRCTGTSCPATPGCCGRRRTGSCVRARRTRLLPTGTTIPTGTTA